MTDSWIDPVERGFRLVVRRRLDASPERIWAALTADEQRSPWFPAELPSPAPVLAGDPPRMLEYTAGPDVLRFEIEPAGTGSLLTLTHIFGPAERGPELRTRWHTALDRLAAGLHP